MAKEEESKKAEFAKISPVKIEKSMTAAEIEAHKIQLEQYYAGKTVSGINEIISESQKNLPSVKKIKLSIVFAVLAFIFFWLGVFFDYLFTLK